MLSSAKFYRKKIAETKEALEKAVFPTTLEKRLKEYKRKLAEAEGQRTLN